MIDARSQERPAVMSVPERHATALSTFAQLPPETQTAVYDIAAKTPVISYPWDLLREEISEHLDDSSVDPKTLITAIRGLIYARQFAAEKPELEFVKSAVKGIQRASATPAKQEQLQTVVVNILALKNLEVSQRAGRLRADHPQHMHDASIVTDLRPIFDGSGGLIEGAVISHTLKLEIATANEDEKEIYLSVDSDDLEKLEAVIQRARRKELALLSFAKSSSLQVVGDEP